MPQFQARAAKRSSSRKPLLWIASIVIVTVGAVCLIPRATSSDSAEANDTPKIESTGNPTNDKLLAMTTAEEALILGKAVGDGCVGQRPYYMGIDKARALAYWSIGCSDNRNFEVQIEPDAVGTSNTMDCSAFKLATKTACFEKVPF